MGCQYHEPSLNGASAFTVAMPRLTFGRGCLVETGQRAANRGLKRVALFTDPALLGGELVATVTNSLQQQSIDVTTFSDIKIEPTDTCAENGATFLKNGNFDGVISLGGGSVIDAAKASLVVLKQGGPLRRYIAAPMGDAMPVRGKFLPHIACPTTSGTGSECTSMSVIRFMDFNTKFVVCHPDMMPDEAIVDPHCTDSLQAKVVASSGFDLLCHALESYTSRSFAKQAHVEDTAARLYIQGANPWSEMIASKALQIADEYLVRGVSDNSDHEARDKLMWGATLAGIAFGNTGTHLPHALSYGVTHLMSDITTEGYDVPSPFVPHGISVAVTAPAVFRYTAAAAPERHLEAASLLGAMQSGAGPEDSGELVANRIISLMKDTGVPNGLSGVGFGKEHVKALAESAQRQKRAIGNAPRDSNLTDLENIYDASHSYW